MPHAAADRTCRDDRESVTVLRGFPGRLRLRVPGLKQDDSLATRLRRDLPGVAGIQRVETSSVTGTVLLIHDPTGERTRLVGAVTAVAAGRPPAEAEPSPDVRDAGAAPGDWHLRPAAEVLSALETSAETGLTEDRARLLFRRVGPNVLVESKTRSPVAILLDQVVNLPTGLLLGSAAVSAATGGLLDAGAIAIVSLVNAAIGFATERDAERTISSLSSVAAADAAVLRSGRQRQVPMPEVVPGDILMLSPGAMIAADGRLLRAQSLSLDESLLTGESLPSGKTAGLLLELNLPLGERSNLVFKGTAVTGGSGRAVVTATGQATEIGRIQALAGEARPPETPLQQQLAEMDRTLIWLSLAACAGMVGIGLLRGYGSAQMLKSAISLAVAAIPEGLPTVATVTMALGIRDMRRHKAVVRRLDAIETLGAVGAVCFDKTGTLTENRMVAQQVDCGETALPRLLQVCALNNEVEIDAEGRRHGSATEKALLDLAEARGLDIERVRSDAPLLETQHRSETRRWMTTRHRAAGGTEFLTVKGSPDEVLGLCGRMADGAPLGETERAQVLEANRRMGAEGLRVLAFAEGDASPRSEAGPAGLRWLGLVGLADPVRPEMAELMASFHAAGIRTVMITGDQTATAYTIAKQLNLSQGGPVEILEGTELDKLDPEILRALAERTHVYARVSPANKLQIVQALQAGGQVIAMTGDGINDSPALRAADIGLAMGSGTPAAHEVADLVLQDDRLTTMHVALGEGRTIYRNIRKAIRFLLSTNLSEILVMLGATALRLGQPLTPMQLLWINLVSDVFPGLGLALEPEDRRVLSEPPRDPKAPILSRDDFREVATEGAVMTATALAANLLVRGLAGEGPRASGATFVALTAGQLLHALSCRSETQSLWRGERLPPNPTLNRTMLALGLLTAGALALPWSRRLLGVTGMTAADWLIAGAAGGGSYLVNETIKSRRPQPASRGPAPPRTPPTGGGPAASQPADSHPTARQPAES
ncbi:cation-translocating P-type ATPase [Algihabitans albus]|uniref:cation-translocating P-type ATPase n=1 Tax=Algihabitans albus TaxID=2164067 RepID=UPI0013C34429|nr:HAD-IC family P-type ATPase [Algihabitans albus]